MTGDSLLSSKVQMMINHGDCTRKIGLTGHLCFVSGTLPGWTSYYHHIPAFMGSVTTSSSRVYCCKVEEQDTQSIRQMLNK